MPELDLSHAQILLLELQPEIVASVKTPAPRSIRRAATAIKQIAEKLSIPIVASVFQVGQNPATLIEELKGIQPILRAEVSAFDNSEVREALAKNHRTVLAVAGISTEIAVLHAVLDARNAGYDVHVLADCCGGLSERTDAAATRRMELAGASPSSVATFFTSRSSTPVAEGDAAVMAALAQLWSWDSARGPQPGSAESKVAALINELSAAWHDGDAFRFARAFSDEARFVAFDGAVLVGSDAIASYHKGPFETYLAGTELMIDIQEVRSIADGAWVVSSLGGVVRDGARRGELVGDSAQTFVIRADKQTVRIEAFHNTRRRPITGPASANVWKEFDRAWFAEDRSS